MQDKGKSRSDFTTEEDWQKYKSNKEAMPKAAFQFGVKMTEGRKVHRDLGKAKDAKLNNQLNKIQGIMEKKVLVPKPLPLHARRNMIAKSLPWHLHCRQLQILYVDCSFARASAQHGLQRSSKSGQCLTAPL